VEHKSDSSETVQTCYKYQSYEAFETKVIDMDHRFTLNIKTSTFRITNSNDGVLWWIVK